MNEYGNYIDKRDLPFYPFVSDNYISQKFREANEETVSERSVRIIRNAAKSLYREHYERNAAETKIGIEECGGKKIFYVKFSYNGDIYYWWEKYDNDIPFPEADYFQEFGAEEHLYRRWSLSDLISSNYTYTLEFRVYKNPVRTYVAFSSNSEQSPLMDTGKFINI